MAESKHTPVARVETTEADAALIAAAPNLAHELGTLLDAIVAFDGSDFEVHGESIERFAHLMDRYHAAAEALARAEGREVDADNLADVLGAAHGESRSHIPAAI